MARRTLSILSMQNCVFMVAVILPLMTVNFALAATDNPTNAGKTIMAKGQVTAQDNDSSRNLKRRSPVFQTDHVLTGELSATQLRMIDGALLSLQASSELAIPLYVFDPADQNGQVQMSLIKGGLRTITGTLQQKSNNYKLTTPVASIGVRGTHYEAEMVEQDLYLAAWQGLIEVEVTVGKADQQFLLGPSASYQFAIVRSDGTVEFLLNTPIAFATGHSSEYLLASSEQDTSIEPPSISIASLKVQDDTIARNDYRVGVGQFNQDYIDNDQLAANWLPEQDFTLLRSGEVTFDRVENHSVVSTQGQIEDFSMSFTVNFDAATVPTGNLSFRDQGGEWFAAFNGLLKADGPSVNVNFASHGNNLADGTIESLLIDQASGILGSLNLFEVDAPDVTANGSFELRSSQP